MAMRPARRKSDTDHSYLITSEIALTDPGSNTVSFKIARTPLPTGLPPTLPSSRLSALALVTFPSVVRITWVKVSVTTSLARTAA